jgi:hypothetical protein
MQRQNLRFPTGVHPMPHALVFDGPADVAAACTETDET